MNIYTYPEPILRVRAEPVEDIDEDIRTLIDQMIQTMYLAKGIGLAANQVGVPKRLIVLESNPGEEISLPEPTVLINPEIVFREGEICTEEACLSVIDYSADVVRASHVMVQGLDRDGNMVEVEGSGLKAVCLQHEIDHLNGILFIDHISSLKRSLYKKKLAKRLKKSDTPA